jgi:hypothetical protein
MNPGPIKYPCTNCKKGVRSNQRAIQCDFCDEWTHMKCTTISLSQYNKLSTSDETFYCTKCIDRIPCFTDSFFHNISIRSSDTEFSNTGSSECGTYQQNVNTVSPFVTKIALNGSLVGSYPLFAVRAGVFNWTWVHVHITT